MPGKAGRSSTTVAAMGDSNLERAVARTVLTQSVIVGAALGVILVSAASLMLASGPRLLTEATGLILTLVVALACGIWVGTPAAQQEELPLRERLSLAGMSTAAAGAFATAWRLYGGFASGAAGRTLGLLLLVAIPVYVLGLVIPLMVAAAERWQEILAEEGSDWRPVGPMLIGVLAGMGAGVFVAGLLLIPVLTAGPVLLLTSLLLLIPLAIPDPQEPLLEEHLVHEASTPFNELRVTELVYPGERQPERRLYLNGEEESAELVRSGAPALAYVAAAEQWLTTITPPGASYLFLGGGAYTLPRRVAERDTSARITVVELDPEVTRAAQQFFGLRREHGIISVHGDARAYLSRNGESPRYDRIYVDVYSGEESLPYPLVTREAFASITHHLRPGGVAAMNVIGTVRGPESARLWSLIRTFDAVFPSVALYSHLGRDYPDRQNLLLAGALSPEHELPQRAGLFERWPREEWAFDAPTIIYHDVFPGPPPTEGRVPRASSISAPESNLPLLQEREG
jgi:spermidine synthase